MSLIEQEAFRNELLSLTYYGDGEYYSGREAERDTIIDRLNEQPTIDPIRAAGGCRCGECRWGQQDDLGVMHCHKYHIHKKPGGYCDDGEPREEQDDG